MIALIMGVYMTVFVIGFVLGAAAGMIFSAFIFNDNDTDDLD